MTTDQTFLHSFTWNVNNFDKTFECNLDIREVVSIEVSNLGMPDSFFVVHLRNHADYEIPMQYYPDFKRMWKTYVG